MLHPQPRKVAALIDGELLSTAMHARSVGRVVFWELQNLVEERKAHPALYFRTQAAGSVVDSAAKHGLMLRRAPLNVISSLTLSAVLLMEECDVIVLIGVDRSYLPLISYLQSRGVEVEVWGANDASATALRSAADKYVSLADDSAPELKRDPPGTIAQVL